MDGSECTQVWIRTNGATGNMALGAQTRSATGAIHVKDDKKEQSTNRTYVCKPFHNTLRPSSFLFET